MRASQRRRTARGASPSGRSASAAGTARRTRARGTPARPRTPRGAPRRAGRSRRGSRPGLRDPGRSVAAAALFDDPPDVIEARQHLGDVALARLADGVRALGQRRVAVEVDDGETAGRLEDLADMEVAVDGLDRDGRPVDPLDLRAYPRRPRGELRVRRERDGHVERRDRLGAPSADVLAAGRADGCAMTDDGVASARAGRRRAGRARGRSTASPASARSRHHSQPSRASGRNASPWASVSSTPAGERQASDPSGAGIRSKPTASRWAIRVAARDGPGPTRRNHFTIARSPTTTDSFVWSTPIGRSEATGTPATNADRPSPGRARRHGPPDSSRATGTTANDPAGSAASATPSRSVRRTAPTTSRVATSVGR